MSKRYVIPPYTSISNAICITEQQSSISSQQNENICPNSVFRREDLEPRSLNFSNQKAILHSQSMNEKHLPLRNNSVIAEKQEKQKNEQRPQRIMESKLHNENHTFHSKSHEFSFVSQNMKWEFDLALNQQISQRLENSVNNESKVIAFHEIYLQDTVCKVFRAWKSVLESERQLNREVAYFVLLKQKITKAKCFNVIRQEAVKRRLQLIRWIRAEDFNVKRHLKYLLHWRARIKRQQRELRDIEFYRTQARKCQFILQLKQYASRRRRSKKAKQHKERTLVSQVYYSFCKAIKSSMLAAQLNEMGELYRRKTLLAEAFFTLEEKRKERVLQLRTNKFIAVRLSTCFAILNRNVLISKRIQLVSQRRTNKIKRQFFGKIYQLKVRALRQNQLEWLLLQRRFTQLRALSALVFSNHVLLYSADKYYEHRQLQTHFAKLKAAQRKSVPIQRMVGRVGSI